MTTQKKSRRAWLYLTEEDQIRLKKLVDAVGTLNDAVILSTLASAGLKACEDAGNRMPLPLKFQITEEPVGDYRMNETPETTQPRKTRR